MGGFFCDEVGDRASRPERYEVEIPPEGAVGYSDSALVAGVTGFPVETSPCGEVLVDLSRWYEWGAQAATAYAVYSSKGEFLRQEYGTGDTAPYPFLSPEGKWIFSCPRWDRAEEAAQAHGRFLAAADRGEKFAGGEVLRHLRSCYRMGNNPLPTLRRKFPGIWTWDRVWAYDAHEAELVFLSERKRYTENGEVWQVTYRPA